MNWCETKKSYVVFELACCKSKMNWPSRAVTPIWYATCLRSFFIEIKMIIKRWPSRAVTPTYLRDNKMMIETKLWASSDEIESRIIQLWRRWMDTNWGESCQSLDSKQHTRARFQVLGHTNSRTRCLPPCPYWFSRQSQGFSNYAWWGSLYPPLLNWTTRNDPFSVVWSRRTGCTCLGTVLNYNCFFGVFCVY